MFGQRVLQIGNERPPGHFVPDGLLPVRGALGGLLAARKQLHVVCMADDVVAECAVIGIARRCGFQDGSLLDTGSDMSETA
mmetsp:Transcript_41263/g.82105  ORF Transcript_41263/g.82105 Transcript_41263/m.82105 type:complete len:81 (-) Transcript_41263:23-265(-)